MEVTELQKEANILFDRLGFRFARTLMEVKDMLVYKNNDVCLTSFWEGEGELWDWNCGAYRVAIWNSNSDYVFKFTYRQLEDCCEIEHRNYTYAMPKGLQQCFAEIIDLGFYYLEQQKLHVYAMRKAYVDEDENRELSSEASFQRFCEENGYDCDDEEIYRQYEYDCSWDLDETDQMLDLARREWGEELYNRFTKFASEHRICDLHAGNWGRINGRLVVIDYAGIV